MHDQETLEIRSKTAIERRAAEIEARRRRERTAPRLLLSLHRHDEATRLMFEGLYQHYLDSVASGRIDVWRKAALAAVEVLASVPEAKVHARRAVP